MKDTSFEARYLKDRKNTNIFGGDTEVFSSWSSDLVAYLLDKDPHCDYKIELIIIPNPPDCKGCDKISIVVWKQLKIAYHKGVIKSQIVRDDPYMAIFSKQHNTIRGCMEDIHEKLKLLYSTPKDEVIEIDGKKFRLTEIK